MWAVVEPLEPKSTELRRAPGRQVTLDSERGVVTKSFRGRTARARLLDGLRAKREFELLTHLVESGVRVPEPLGLEHGSDGVWRVHLAEIPGARTAEEALQPQAGRERLLGELARLLAGLHRAGVDQPDLHAKNALVDAAGKAWAIDFHAARHLLGGMRARILHRDLVRLTAAHREGLGLRARQRFLLNWWRALPVELAERLPERGEFAATLEAEGRRARRAACAAYAKPSSRYFRVGGSCRAVAAEDLASGEVPPGFQPSARWLARRDAPPAHSAAALAGEPHPALARITGTRSDVEAAWGAVARLAAHGLPGPRPLLLDRREPALASAWFDFDLGAEPLALERALDAPALPPTPHQRAALDAALEFRGLQLVTEVPASFLTCDGAWLLSPEARVETAGGVGESSERSKRQARRARRRARRERLGRLWPHLTDPALRPLTGALLTTVAAAARFSPLETRLRRNLSRGLPERAPKDLTPHVRRHMARLALEWGQMARGTKVLAERVALDESLAAVEAQLVPGRGALWITPHLGNWELAAAALVQRGLLDAVVGRRRLRDPSGRVLEEWRAAVGVETLPQDSHPRDLLRRIARGERIGLLPDIEVQRLAGTRMPFLGREALVMTAPAALARAAHVPIFAGCCVMDEGEDGPHGPYRLHFAAPLEAPRSREETVTVTAAWVAIFEDWIRAFPSQWLWVHDRWRTPQSAADGAPLGALRQVQDQARRTSD